jgi:hypothetical protein
LNFRDYLNEIIRGRLLQTPLSHSGWLVNASQSYLEQHKERVFPEFKSRELTAPELQQALLKVEETLRSERVTKSGAHRLPDWTQGWQENLDALRETSSREALTPRYFRPYTTQQYMGKWIKCEEPEGFELDFLHNLLCVILLQVRQELPFNTLVEFGCGTGHNLVSLASQLPDLRLIGCDWAPSSQAILSEIATRFNLDISGNQFDFFSPKLEIEPGFCALTVASMEQIGTGFEPFLDFLIRSQPSCVVHLEPIEELLPDTEPLANISRQYFKKRNYLSGYLSQLMELEKSQSIEIFSAERSGFGSFFIEGYSVIIWRPKTVEQAR